MAELFHNAAVVVRIVGGPRLTKGQDSSAPLALAAWGWRGGGRGGGVGKWSHRIIIG